MGELIKIPGLQYTNAGEATFGDIRVFGQTIVIPYLNIHIIDGLCPPQLISASGKYIHHSYLVFQGVNGIIWESQMAARAFSDRSECYGGGYYYSDDYHEFWLKYQKGFLLLPNDYKVSEEMWPEYNKGDIPFFEGTDMLNQIKIEILNK